MKLFKFIKQNSSNTRAGSEHQKSSHLNKIALKQLKLANAINEEAEKIKTILKSFEEHSEYDYSSLKKINKKAEEALSSIILEKTRLQAELSKLM